MSAFTPASEVLLRHSDDFEPARVLFAGDLQDDLPARLDTAASRAHTQQFHHWQVLNGQMGENVRFSLVAEASDVADCDTLIYYWPKNKPEAQFQLMNLLSLLPVGIDVFVVGENRSGVRSAEQMLAEYVPLTKVDSARRCGLYHGRLEKQPTFDPQQYWGEYPLENLTIKTLPGVFSRDGLDIGSQLLLSTLTPHTKGKVLDVGCGAGVLATVLASHSPKVRLTLCDVSAPAVEASHATLAANGIEGDVFRQQCVLRGERSFRHDYLQPTVPRWPADQPGSCANADSRRGPSSEQRRGAAYCRQRLPAVSGCAG